MAYSEKEKTDIIDKICELIKQGDSLRKALSNEGMPEDDTFHRWLRNDENKNGQYARACELRADLIFEEILEIADESQKDKKTLVDGKEVIDSEVVQRSRLRIDARKWMLSKMEPKKYGDKLDVTTDGKSITSSLEVTIHRPKEDED